jgi:hypothetical protein
MGHTQDMALTIMRNAISDIRSDDDVEAVNEAADLHQKLLELIGDCAEVRRTHIRALRAAGWSGREIGDACNMTHQRVYQLEAGADRKEKG